MSLQNMSIHIFLLPIMADPLLFYQALCQQISMQGFFCFHSSLELKRILLQHGEMNRFLMTKATREMRVVLKYYLNNPLQLLFNETPKILSSKNRQYILYHTYCIILPDFPKICQSHIVSYIQCHTDFSSDVQYHTHPNILSYFKSGVGQTKISQFVLKECPLTPAVAASRSETKPGFTNYQPRVFKIIFFLQKFKDLKQFL